jgi:phosphopantothenoylcysteine synthetase/decarboxylase
LKNKRSRGSRLGSQDVRALDQTSDYNMAEDIVQPMGELLQTFGNEDDDDEIILPHDDHDDVPKTS